MVAGRFGPEVVRAGGRYHGAWGARLVAVAREAVPVSCKRERYVLPSVAAHAWRQVQRTVAARTDKLME
eukprot:8441178-Lingulodinium_polyedra.AAC.1